MRALLLAAACTALALPRLALAAPDSLRVAPPPARDSADSLRLPRLAGDSTLAPRPASDSARDVARGTTIPRTVQRGPRMMFYGGLVAGLAANYRMKLDQDPGGYTDRWTTSSMFPDKGVHGLAAFTLTTLGVDLGVKPWKSAMAVCAAGIAFEYTQGYVSRYDIGADCIGASGAALWRSWRGARSGPAR